MSVTQSLTLPLVSVIMPTWNGRAFIASAIASLQDQDHEALEILVVDDGSTDDTRAIVRGIAATDARIVLIEQRRGGIAAARNLGLARASGDLIGFLDHDDLCPGGKIARQVGRLSEEPEAVAVFGRTILFSASAKISVEEAAASGQPVLTMVLASALFRRRVFDAIGQLDPLFRLADDFDFILRLVESGLTLALEEDVAALHRRHEGQATHDVAATRSDMMRALSVSLKRRRAAGMVGPLRHPLVERGRP